MKTEQEQLEFQQKQKEIAKIHSDLVASIGEPKTEEHVKIIQDSEDKMVKSMQKLVYDYLGPDFAKMMEEKESNQ
jgi:hypothetical protein